MTMHETITLAHGNGGRYSWELIDSLFLRYFGGANPERNDAAELTLPGSRIAFTTDSYVVSPIVFPGGDIGKLAVCGTVNDLLTTGARPRYLSCGFILEEGLALGMLEQVVASMARTAAACGVAIVTGDTKVVGRGAADRLFINTAGIGLAREGVTLSPRHMRPGDQVIVTGTLGEHGAAILLAREGFSIQTDIISDCAPLDGLVDAVLATGATVHVMRDPTRGGLAATLNELAAQSGTGITIREADLPILDPVRGVCDILGLDPLYLANEGKMVIITPPESCDMVLGALAAHPLGRQARAIGEVVEAPHGRVLMHTAIGKRMLDMPVLEQVPRIC